MSESSVRYLSPLRYPGGKRRLAPFVGELISQQRTSFTRYVEPFAGGAGVALSLLVNEYVDEIVVNDLDKGVAALWRSMIDHTDEFTELVSKCRPSVNEWHIQRDRYITNTGNDVELGFATFFLNRTNRSGIIGAGPIGGFNQMGKWKIDARFESDRLIDRIKFIARYRSRITVCEEDGIELTRRHVGDKCTFIYADPPYLQKADDLYLNTLTWADHQRLADSLRNAQGWFLTYDVDERVPSELYQGLRCAVFDIAHTAAIQHVGREYAVFADSLIVSNLDGLGRNAECVNY